MRQKLPETLLESQYLNLTKKKKNSGVLRMRSEKIVYK